MYGVPFLRASFFLTSVVLSVRVCLDEPAAKRRAIPFSCFLLTTAALVFAALVRLLPPPVVGSLAPVRRFCDVTGMEGTERVGADDRHDLRLVAGARETCLLRLRLDGAVREASSCVSCERVTRTD